MTDTPTNIFDKAVDQAQTELWTPISRIEKSEDDPDVRIVYGLVSDTSVDADKQRCDGEWLRGALTKWFNEWGNIREMHQPKAVGRAVSLVEEDTNRWFLTSRIVDKEAVRKLDEGVLQGYSINVFWPKLRKDPTSAAALGLICGGDIGETSLVDRPANNNSKIALMKAVGYEIPTTEKFVPTSYVDTEAAGSGGIADTEYGVGDEPRSGPEAKKDMGCDCEDPCQYSDCTCSDSKCTKCDGSSPSIEKADSGNGRKSPPKGYPKDSSSYASPKDYGWPVDTAVRTRSALAYYNAGKGRKNHSDSEWASIGRKIATAANKFFGGGYSLTDGKVQKSQSAEKALNFANTRDFTLTHLAKAFGTEITPETIVKDLQVPDLLKMDELEDSHLAFMAAEIIRELLVREASEFEPDESKVSATLPLASIYDSLMNIAREEYQEAYDPIMKMGGVLAALLRPEDEPMSDEIKEDVNETESVEETPETPIDKSLTTPNPDPTPDSLESPVELLKAFKAEMDLTLAAKTAEIEALTAKLEEFGNRAVDNGPLIADISKSLGTSARLTKLADLKNRAAKSFADAKGNPDMMMRSASFAEYSHLRQEIDALEKE